MLDIRCTQNNADQIRKKGFVTLNIDPKCALVMRTKNVAQMRLCEVSKKGLICGFVNFDSYESVDGSEGGTRFYIKDVFNAWQKSEQEKNWQKKSKRK